MVQSTSQKPRRRRRIRLIAAFMIGAIVLYDSSAYAINAIASQDLPVLVQILATELGEYGQLAAILTETAAIVAQVKEYTTVAKTVYGAIDELRHLSLADIKDAARRGLLAAYPELGQMVDDIGDIRDLNYRDQRAMTTIRGALWEEVYGPAIEYLSPGQKNFEAAAAMEELRGRQLRKVAYHRTYIENYLKDCDETSRDGKGEGACQAAASRASLRQALLLSELAETQLQALDAEKRGLERADRQELDRIYAAQRWMHDMKNMMAAYTDDPSCTAGSCLYERYGEHMYERIESYQRRHPDLTRPDGQGLSSIAPNRREVNQGTPVTVSTR